MNINYGLLADGVLVLHFLIVAFIVIGLVLILAGGMLSWRWIGNLWFRLLHLAAIGELGGDVASIQPLSPRS